MKNKDWAITCAADFLRRRSHLIIETDAPCRVAGREVRIPLVAWDEPCETVAFVTVRTPATEGWRNPTRKQRTETKRAGLSWKRRMKWDGAVRFDVIDVYGSPDKGRPVIDHVTNVGME